jgi:hypothetical protein
MTAVAGLLVGRVAMRFSPWVSRFNNQPTLSFFSPFAPRVSHLLLNPWPKLSAGARLLALPPVESKHRKPCRANKTGKRLTSTFPNMCFTLGLHRVDRVSMQQLFTVGHVPPLHGPTLSHPKHPILYIFSLSPLLFTLLFLGLLREPFL